MRISTRRAGWRETAIEEWLRNPMYTKKPLSAQKEVGLSHSTPKFVVVRDTGGRSAGGDLACNNSVQVILKKQDKIQIHLRLTSSTARQLTVLVGTKEIAAIIKK